MTDSSTTTSGPSVAEPGARKAFHQRDSFRQSLGIALVVVLAWFGRPLPGLWWAGAVVAVAGIVVRMWASGHIKKNKELATDGPYAFVRHPLYVGNLLISVGFCLASGLWWSVPLMLAFWLLFYPTAIRVEDAKLHRLFGEPWEAWRAQTRALIPRLTPYRGAAGAAEGGEASGWSFLYSLRLNGEPVIALFLLGCLYVLYLRLGA